MARSKGEQRGKPASEQPPPGMSSPYTALRHRQYKLHFSHKDLARKASIHAVICWTRPQHAAVLDSPPRRSSRPGGD